MSLYRWYRWFRKNNRYVYTKWHLTAPEDKYQRSEGQPIRTRCGRIAPKRCGEEFLFDGRPGIVSPPYRLADVCPDCRAAQAREQAAAKASHQQRQLDFTEGQSHAA